MSKVVTVLGGSGYIGKHCIYKLLKNSNATVFSVSRSGKIDMSNYDLTDLEKERLKIVKASALSKEDLKPVLSQSTGVIHSIGTLITFDKNGPNSYDTLGRQTALVAAEVLKENKDITNFVYISAQRGLPFPLSILFGDYIKSKRKAESELLEMKHLKTTVLQPGVVCDPKVRSWSVPLYHSVNLVNKVEKNVLNLILPGIGDKLNLPSSGTMLDMLANYAAKGSLGELNKNKYSAEEMI